MNIQIKWPTISIVMATLNSSRTIKECLDSIRTQKYKGKIELLILDGGSSDETLIIAKQNHAKIIFNKLKTAEAAKALGIKKASGSIIALIDSDNILPNSLWLEKLVKPLVKDPTVIASEPIYFEYRKSDHWLTRYFALIGMGDPVNLFIGNYDKYNYVSNKWTGLDFFQEKVNGYLKIKLENRIPTIGANGFLIRKSALDTYPINDYLFDVDVLEYLVKKRPIFVAKVYQGIVHLFSGDVSTFVRKQRRRIRDYLYHYYYKNSKKTENSLESPFIFWGIVKFIISCLLIFPLFIQSLIGYSRKKDMAWIFHPLACYITLFSYTYETIRFIFIKEEYSRKGWKQ